MREVLQLRNDFHNTACNVTMSDGQLTGKQAIRAKAKLCGVDGCTCGGEFGERGPQFDSHCQRVRIIPITEELFDVCAC